MQSFRKKVNTWLKYVTYSVLIKKKREMTIISYPKKKGRKEAQAAGKAILAANMKFDVAHTSVLTRAQNTLAAILVILKLWIKAKPSVSIDNLMIKI